MAKMKPRQQRHLVEKLENLHYQNVYNFRPMIFLLAVCLSSWSMVNDLGMSSNLSYPKRAKLFSNIVTSSLWGDIHLGKGPVLALRRGLLRVTKFYWSLVIEATAAPRISSTKFCFLLNFLLTISLLDMVQWISLKWNKRLAFVLKRIILIRVTLKSTNFQDSLKSVTTDKVRGGVT